MGEALRLIGIVPAAGASRRMGTRKQLLPVNGRPMVLGVVEALLDGGVGRVVIVVNSDIAAQLPQLPTGTSIAINDEPESEMIDSIRIGLGAIPDPCDGYVVCPCDTTGLSARDVDSCIRMFEQNPRYIVVASRAGKRGHPVIFPASLTDAARGSECESGLNHLARNRPDRVLLVECPSDGVVSNTNTPGEYRAWNPETP